MDLLEYQGKQLFARHGVPIPEGRPAPTVEVAVEAAEDIGYPCVVKAQVQIGGRGKLGGIKVANNRQEAEQHARAILGMDIRGLTVHELWIPAASAPALGCHGSGGFHPPAPTSPPCSAFKIFTADAWATKRGSTPTSCGPWAGCWPSCMRCSCPRRR